MKCRSVAGVWTVSPPPHKVTASAVLCRPPTIYTGGSDGSIICWNIDPNQEIKPAAMLCGHASPVANLGICYPVVASGDNNRDYWSNVGDRDHSGAALISACTEGILCVWSRDSGHCRRRRKLPPWVGSPSVVRVLPSNQRYVCISCCFVDALCAHENHSVELESTQGNPSKCSVVVVDTYTLTIIQTVFHGNLSIGSLMFMAIVSSIEEKEKQFAVLVDSIGKTQLIPVSIDSRQDGEEGTGLQRSSSNKDISMWDNEFDQRGQVLSISTSKQILAIVFKDSCIFRSISYGSVVGQISFTDTFLCFGGSTSQSYVVGGMFLENDDSGTTWSEFAVWNDKGAVLVYTISYLDGHFKFEPVCEISAVDHSVDIQLSIRLVHMSSYLFRIESRCSQDDHPLIWRPLVTMWSMHQQNNNQGLCQQGKMLGKSSSFVDWIGSSDDSLEAENQRQNLQKNTISSKKSVNKNSEYEEKYNFVQEDRAVSSSMVISESFNTPYAVVYGLYNGEIEVVRFDVIFGGEDDSHVAKQHFSGHTGAILCLASHCIVGKSKFGSFNHVLMSGSMDSTIRIWDLESSNLITVMHQHVAPVKQIILAPAGTDQPWSDCFLSVGEDSSVALASLETLRVERMFSGHPNYPAKIVWDGARGYIACLCQNLSRVSENMDVLFIWDIKTGTRERVLRGSASHSVFENFCEGIHINSLSGSLLSGNTSVSSLILPIVEDKILSQSHVKKLMNEVNLLNMVPSKTYTRKTNKNPIKCSCPFPGIASLSFDLESLMSLQKHEFSEKCGIKLPKNHLNELEREAGIHGNGATIDQSKINQRLNDYIEEDMVISHENCLFRFTLSLLHIWNVDSELDKMLVTDMKLKRPEKFFVASGMQGDRGSLTLTFPCLSANLELWKSSSEFGAMRSLVMVSLAQRMISLSHFNTAASSALAAFYTRNFAEMIPAVKPPLLQLLVSFWQDESEHVRMAARSLFHCAASRAIPLPLCSKRTSDHKKYLILTDEIEKSENQNANKEETSTNKSESEVEEFNIRAWLESYEVQDWISCVGGTSQDAMTSHIIVASALAIWYPSLVKPNLATLVVHSLIKLVMAMNEKYTSTAAELLAEGMGSTWSLCINSEIPRLIADIFFQIECLSGASDSPVTVQETLVGILLPSLAAADISGFLTVIESQIWSTASDSPVHLVSLMTLIRLVRGSPRNLVQYLDKAVNFILQTIDPSNSVLRKICLQTAMTALKDVTRVFPMVALNETLSRLAVGDVIGDVRRASICVYDMQSVMKTKVLDASGPPGLPSMLAEASEAMVTTAISALSFSPDGEGLVAFSEHGLMTRWWSLGSSWWERLNRNLTPVQCTKLIFVPPWEGFSPNSSRSSIMAKIMGHDRQANLQENTNNFSDDVNTKNLSEADNLKRVIQNIDLSYRLEWIGERQVLLTRHGLELGNFPL